MDFFSRLSRTDADAEPTDLGQVRADDALIEALRGIPLFEAPAASSDDEAYDTRGSEPGSGSTTVATTPADAQVLQLLKSWRTEIDSIPLPPPIDLEVAVGVVRSAPARRRTVRPMLAVTAAIAALLLGSAAIGSRSATPESFLFPVTQLLWADRADSMLAGIDAREGIAKANEYLDAGHPDQAGVALDHVTVVITKVEDRDGRQTLESDYQEAKQQLESVSSTVTPPVSTLPATTSPAQVPPTSVASVPPSVPPDETPEPAAPNTDQTVTEPNPTPTPETSPDTSSPAEPSTTPTEATESSPSETPTSSTQTTPTESSTPIASDQDGDDRTPDGEQQGLVGNQAPANNLSEQTSNAATP